LTALFILSFFPWHTLPASLWQLAFTERGNGLFLAYTLLTIFLAWPLSVAALLLEQGLVPLPPVLRPWLGWKYLLIGVLLAIGLILLAFDYLHQHFYEFENHLAIAMKIAARLHVLAFVVCLLGFWLQHRRRRNLPLPRFEMRW
jgi:hypothetical protein